jgi:RNA polymerase sigma-70 factor (ECF subfamily)
MSRRVNERPDGATSGAGDAELLADMRAASGDALGALVHRYSRLVHRVAADILRDATEAEDVTQEVFFEIYRKAHLYDPARGSVRVWLLQYAYHRSLRRRDSLRRRAAYRGEPIEALEMRPSGPRRELSRDECRWMIRAGFAQLPARQRATLELVWLEGLSLSDVATRLRVSFGCARHYYYRGLARLRMWARCTHLAATSARASRVDPMHRVAPGPRATPAPRGAASPRATSGPRLPPGPRPRSRRAGRQPSRSAERSTRPKERPA